MTNGIIKKDDGYYRVAKLISKLPGLSTANEENDNTNRLHLTIKKPKGDFPGKNEFGNFFIEKGIAFSREKVK